MATSYNPEEVNVNVDGATLTRFAGDGIITVSKNEGAVTPNVGVQGDMMYEESANESGMAAVTLQQTSSSLQKLRNLASNRKRFALTISNANDDAPANVSGSECRILKEPDIVRGKNTNIVTISIYVPSLRIRQ